LSFAKRVTGRWEMDIFILVILLFVVGTIISALGMSTRSKRRGNGTSAGTDYHSAGDYSSNSRPGNDSGGNSDSGSGDSGSSGGD